MNLSTKEQCIEILDEYEVPENIRRHSELVNEAAVFIAEKLREKGEDVNVELVEKAAILHDLDKIITKGKGNHGEKSFEILSEKGYEEVGRVIRAHVFKYLLKMDFKNWEEKILNYADKIVKYDIVSVKERFEDFDKRYSIEKEKIKLGEENCLKLEKEILTKINIKPENLKQEIEND